jgi:flagellar basal body-associated protein FliL
MRYYNENNLKLKKSNLLFIMLIIGLVVTINVQSKAYTHDSNFGKQEEFKAINDTFPPVISDVSHTPTFPDNNAMVYISASITDKLYYRVC